MSIQKKSLTSTSKTSKKANVASTDLIAKPSTVATKKMYASTRKLLKRSNIASKAMNAYLRLD
jgi:hypothetical protein